MKEPTITPLKNLWLFTVTLLDSKFKSFICGAYFSKGGNANIISDKFVFALQKLYKEFNITLKYLVFDGDRHNYSEYVDPLFTWIWDNK